MKFSYLPLERKLVLIYWMMKILQSHISLVKPYITQPVINFHRRLNKKIGSYIPMKKCLSQIKVRLINSVAIKLQMENPRSRLFYAEERPTIE